MVKNSNAHVSHSIKDLFFRWCLLQKCFLWVQILHINFGTVQQCKQQQRYSNNLCHFLHHI